MFEQVVRKKLRFESPQGLLSAEDLWDLPLTSTKGRANLDDIARNLHRQLKNGDDVSFVNTEAKSDPTIQLKFDTVKYVIDVLLKERDDRSKEEARARNKQKILALIEEKQDEQMKSLDIDALKRLLAEQ